MIWLKLQDINWVPGCGAWYKTGFKFAHTVYPTEPKPTIRHVYFLYRSY